MVDEDILETAVLAETGMKTPWTRYTLDEFIARLKEGLPTYHEKVIALEKAPADIAMPPHDDTMAPTDVKLPRYRYRERRRPGAGRRYISSP